MPSRNAFRKSGPNPASAPGDITTQVLFFFKHRIHSKHQTQKDISMIKFKPVSKGNFVLEMKKRR